MTCRPQTYDQFCKDKLTALDWYFGHNGNSPVLASLANRSRAGVYLWAAQSLMETEGEEDRFFRYCQEAKEIDPTNPRHQLLLQSFERIQQEIARSKELAVVEENSVSEEDSQPDEDLVENSQILSTLRRDPLGRVRHSLSAMRQAWQHWPPEKEAA